MVTTTITTTKSDARFLCRVVNLSTKAVTSGVFRVLKLPENK